MKDHAIGTKTIASPLGPIEIELEGEQVTRVAFSTEAPPREHADPSPLFVEVTSQLTAYFEARLRTFDLPLAPCGTPFQLTVWHELARIPHGETRSYAEVAARIGRPSAVRAVGAANGKNPIAIVLPCHRVIGAGGALTGYAWGLARKAWLLAHEGAAHVDGRSASSAALRAASTAEGRVARSTQVDGRSASSAALRAASTAEGRVARPTTQLSSAEPRAAGEGF